MIKFYSNLHHWIHASFLSPLHGCVGNNVFETEGQPLDVRDVLFLNSFPPVRSARQEVLSFLHAGAEPHGGRPRDPDHDGDLRVLTTDHTRVYLSGKSIGD